MTRNGGYVDFTQQGFLVRFSVPFGGAPLEWYMTENGQKISVVSQPAGEGAQVLWDTGQDYTQGTATGINGNIVKPLSTPWVSGSEYYCREEAFLPDRDGHEALYKVGGCAPAFWISVDRIDDAFLPDPRIVNSLPNDSQFKWCGRWCLKYNDILSLGPNHYHQLGTPIYFCPTAEVGSGMLFPGDTIRQQYYPQIYNGALCPNYLSLARIEQGHAAIRMRITMKNASLGSMAAFIFGIEKEITPSDTIHTVYAAPWSAVFIGKEGNLDFWDRGVVKTAVPLTPAYKTILHTDDGLLVDIRTLNDKVQIWVEGVFKAEVTRTCFGPYTALLGAGSTGGRIGFRHRELFDVGSNFSAEYRTTQRNTLIQKCSAFRVKAPWSIPAYRMALPGQFCDPLIRELAQRWNNDGVEVPTIDLSNPGNYPFMKDTKAIYIGKADGSAGMFGVLRGHTYMPPNDLAHVGVDTLAMGFNNLPYTANLEPVPFTAYTVESEWAPKRRLEIL